MPQFTPTEQRILNVLSDGMLHSKDELMKCLDDDLAQRSAVDPHISNLRKKLNPVGQHITCETNGNAWTFKYRHVRLLDPNSE